MTVSRRDFLKAVGITSGCFTFGGAGLIAAQPSENFLPPPDEYTEAKKEVYRQLYGGSPTGTAIEPYVKDAPRYSDIDAFIPDIWARTALNILNENMVAGNLVDRNFENEVAQHGDVVNVCKPNNFIMRRMSDEGPHSFEMATMQRVVVPLDAHFYSTFIIRDGDAMRSFKDLVDLFVLPSMLAMSRGVDRYVIEKMWIEGDKNVVTNHDVQDLILDARMQLNNNRTYARDRHMIVPLSWRLPRFIDPDVPNKFSYLGFDIYEDVDVEQGIAFHRSALALLNRPLMTTEALGMRIGGTLSNDISMRCSMTYDAMKAGTRVTFDTLFGAAVLEPDMIVVANRRELKRGAFYDTGVERPKFIAPPEKPAEYLSRLRLEHEG